MVFIDGTWLAFSANRLADQHGLLGRTGGPLDFGALPRVCAQEVASQMAVTMGLDVVRTHYFGSIATNYDAVDQDAVQRRSEFFDSLRRHHRYEVYRYETDYRGHRVRRTPGDDGFSPPEKAVDVGLATALLEMAAVSAYDIAIVVCGDRDFVPALQAVRRLGKRVAIVSARGSCAREFSDPNDPMRVRDFDTMWLDNLWTQVVSPAARPLARTVDEGARDTVAEMSEAPDVPPFDETVVDSPYADDRMAAAAVPTAGSASLGDTELPVADRGTVGGPAGATQLGTVTKVHANGYGFVRGDDGADYYFRRGDFVDVSEFVRLERFRSRLSFRVSEAARPGQAGRAAAVAISGVADGSGFVGYRSPAPVAYANGHYGANASTMHSTERHVAAPSAVFTDDLWAADPFAAPRRRLESAPVPPVPVATTAAASAATATIAPDSTMSSVALDVADDDIDPFAPPPRTALSQPAVAPIEREVSVATPLPTPVDMAAVAAPPAEEPEAVAPVKKKRAPRKSVSA
ncbi:hypothetical protein MASR1M101_07950 [Gemmatimonas sp.]